MEKTTTTIKINEIPDYLKNSEFYLNLEITNNDSNTIVIPAINFKQDCKIRNFDELIKLLHTLRFWMAPIEDFYCVIFDFVKMCNVIRYAELYEIFSDIEIINDIKYLHQIYFIERKSIPVIITEQELNKVCQLGLLYLLKYFHRHKCKLNEDMMYCCVQYGQLECLKYLHNNGVIIDENLLNTSCLFGNFECLTYLHHMGFKIDEGCVNSSIKSNNLECVKYCLENGGKLTITSYVYLNKLKKYYNTMHLQNYIDDNYNFINIANDEQQLHQRINSINDDNFDY